MRNLNQQTATATGTNAIAAATIAAPPSPDQRWRIKSVVASLSGTPAAATLLTISSDNSGAVGPTGQALPGAGVHVLATLPIGALPLVLNDLDLRGYPGGSVIASLAAGGASVVGGVLLIATFEGA